VQYAKASRIAGAVKDGTRSAVGLQRRYGSLVPTGIELPGLVLRSIYCESGGMLGVRRWARVAYSCFEQQ